VDDGCSDMKILHVLDHSAPLHSGYTFRTLAILREQQALGWETVQVTSSKQGHCGAAREEAGGQVFHRTPVPDRLWWGLPVLNQWAVVRGLERRLVDVIRDERPDVLHAHSPSLNGIAAIRVGRALGLPVVYECRAFWEDAAADHGTSPQGGARYRATRALETWAFRRADAVTCICEGLRRDIVIRGIGENRIRVIPNGVDIDRFQYGAARDEGLAKALGLETATVLGFLGSFYAYEGIELAIAAMPEILRRIPAARLLLVGGGPQESSLRNLSRRLGLDREVLFVGRVPHALVDQYYSLVDLAVFPRLAMRLTETVTPLKPLEAMAQGKLVLASDVGGHRELIDDCRTGWLFRAGDVGAFADAVVRVLASQQSWGLQREAARQYVERQRSWRTCVSGYESVYGLARGEVPAAIFESGAS
jgi:PEP-CTERM/exosortase A-associated glycosyltransferase